MGLSRESGFQLLKSLPKLIPEKRVRYPFRKAKMFIVSLAITAVALVVFVAWVFTNRPEQN